MIIKTGLLCEPYEGLLVIATTRVMDMDQSAWHFGWMEWNKTMSFVFFHVSIVGTIHNIYGSTLATWA
jgi:hypothetical protein